ncbi:Rne/Rng family ribonuclease [Wenzhouxiangella marina]|uniref:Ribonuclease E n=1 Tax=Wenzhouxiangella marina TaxID=1579979 RepID=A0A0K0XX45_9GAMM|nr:Rne/Rng family ribonuclease [Wenzhouxiangella marina]AKS42197.1 Ribonuclease E [Wenzhouxiangella marina]MBB6086031.1 ribonuclease E [Wenzhouxiangella marina]
MKRMLINATQPEEVRVAIADGQALLDLDIEVPAQEQKKSNIYKGRITRVEPSLDACFVEFGSERHGFLSMKEIAPEYFNDESRKQFDAGQRVDIKDAVKAGQEVIVQVDKEERGTKGAALTTYISLAGRYLVLMPNNPRAGGVSRQISRDDRKELLDTLKMIEVPDGMGLIVRTAGVGREQEELQWDLDYLLQLWEAIKTASQARQAPFLIYQESKLIIRALRDYLREDIGEILIDDDQVFEDAREFMQQVMPHNLRKLKAYRDAIPLFSRYQIESQIESAFSREVRLPSGGALVIDHTEALLSIDINSARATKGSDIEETALQTNLEAAEEIARQLRIRDLGGLIVIDFIDMMSKDAQRQVENRLRDAMRMDKARVQFGRISRFGLLEMSRQRLRPSLGESSYITCPRCIGMGSIRSIESLALSILRLAEEEAMKDNTARVLIQAPIAVANFLLNEKRSVMAEIERRNKLPITVVANENLETPRFEVQRLRSAEDIDEPSYSLATDEVEANSGYQRSEQMQPPPKPAAQAAVSGVRPASPAPLRKSEDRGGFFAWLKAFFASLFSGSDEDRRSKNAAKDPQGGRGRKGQFSRDHHRKRHQGAGQDDDGSPGAQKKKKKKKKKRSAKKDEQNGNAGNQGNNNAQADGDSGTPDDQKPRKKRRRRGGKKRRSRAANRDEAGNNGNDNGGNAGAQGGDGGNRGQSDGDKPRGKDKRGGSEDAASDAKPSGTGETPRAPSGQQGARNEASSSANSSSASAPVTPSSAEAAKPASQASESGQASSDKPAPARPAPAAQPSPASGEAKASGSAAATTDRSGEAGRERTNPPQDSKPSPAPAERRSESNAPSSPAAQSTSERPSRPSEQPKAVRGDDGIYRLTESSKPEGSSGSDKG